MLGAVAAGAAGLAVGYTVGGHLLGQALALRRRPDLPDAVCLTFDDGPDPETTPPILDCLARHQAPAAFFIVGRRAERYPEVVREVVASGHDLGNHTYSHRHLWTLGPWSTAAEVRWGAEAIAQAAGTAPVAFRPPWGAMNAAALATVQRMRQPLVLWSVRSEGYRWRPSVEEMVEHIVGRASGGDIIDLHDAGGFPDTPARVLAALPLLIPRLRDAGLRPLPLSAFL